MKTERRKFRRLTTGSETVQAAAAGSGKKFSVKDIGKGGLMVEYIPVANEPFETENIDIIAMDYDRVYLPEISCETVYDILTLVQDTSFSGGTLRLRGLKFVELTRKQEEALNILIDHCRNSMSFA